MKDWLLEDHPAPHVSDLVDGLGLCVLYTPYEFHMMLKELIYGYVSSRGLARKLEEDVAFGS